MQIYHKIYMLIHPEAEYNELQLRLKFKPRLKLFKYGLWRNSFIVLANLTLFG